MKQKPLISYFYSFFAVWLIASVLLFIYGGFFALYQGTILSVLELSLSFDNAVVNATILATMALVWRRRFLIWGMIIAVFGVRFVFPILIVYFSTSMGFIDSFNLAVSDPDKYEKIIQSSHHVIMSFGGMFLLMLFLKFIFDENKDTHWVKYIEKFATKLSKIGDIKALFIMFLILAITYIAPNEVVMGDNMVKVDKLEIIVPMIIGVIAFYLLELLKGAIELKTETNSDLKVTELSGGLISFLYLEVIDMSFSLDGVLGAFAITQNVVIIMLGLGIGAMAVRSLTIFMVEREVVSKYIYLEHGAMWSIGLLSLSMLIQIFYHLPPMLITTFAIVPICLAFIHSIYKNREFITDPK
ncbi:hypothetical protein CRU87_02370 [Aliarcobacter trophiarum LMG 25534]|uniref:DUF475 domain-containing membrane protein n=1 Tax=Aliarcobacter trophiarum LMG 25534 TaxID=1032241 RepID=A0AAD0QJ74_9BACT|nr:DUF475 domain-containing protein [Aliarcobacter trophiarum]AXK48912.1 DUF475 domain-containing membrane protein [Aliarcobacter trophiarum LMG 25534]RXI24914.1 hypothetical protein CRU89_08860 [Aliarcobacter trophiarum]RXJ92644.1 hypothetical protein CRU87_02370 [Aliarcobacter trophiarum LMG 25534]